MTTTSGLYIGKANDGVRPHANIHCIRIYNRALTTEEVIYNTQIDKERFGL